MLSRNTMLVSSVPPLPQMRKELKVFYYLHTIGFIVKNAVFGPRGLF